MAGSNNFKVFDENSQNIMSDADYNSNTARQNGVSTGLASSQLHNKLFRQISMMVTALGECIKNKGLVASDSDLAALVEVLQNTFQPQLPNLKLSVSETIPSLANDVDTLVSWGPANPEIWIGHHMSYDTHGMFNPAVPTQFECKVSGKYRITSSIDFIGLSGGRIQLSLYYETQDGETISELVDRSTVAPGSSVEAQVRLNSSVELHEGDIIKVYVKNLNAGNAFVNNGHITSRICIECFELI